MSKTRWTENQNKAIYSEGTNILVSAGAGSGKTAVLTERILEKLKKGISVDNLIVLTFTNASAFEMKERVRNKLRNEISKGNTSLKEELDKIDNSNICTFDSFCLNLVKKYHYLLGIGKNISICDNILLKNTKANLMDEIFDDYYESENSLFLEFLDVFTVKDDKKIRRMLLELDKSLDNLSSKEEYLDEYLIKNYTNENINLYVVEYVSNIHKIKEDLFAKFELLESLATHDKISRFISEMYNNINFLEKANQYNDYVEIKNCKLPRFPSGKDLVDEDLTVIKKIHEQIKNFLGEIKKLCCYENEKSIIDELLDTKKSAEIIVEILKNFNTKCMNFKKKNNVYEFSDISSLAIKLLKENDEIRENLKENINEIMIDEYQDTNDINECVVSLISDNNIYMVGDVKQSIYGFRNANPNLFMEKYQNYSNNDNGIKIDLLENFRSREEVLIDINFLFNKLMTKKLGGADYKNGHQMLYGNKTFDIKDNNQNYNLDFLNYKYEKGRFTKEEVEAYIIAKDIRKKIDNRFQVLDNNKLRNSEYKDFAILMDRKKSFDTYKKLFNNLGIPLTIHKEESFINSDEIMVIKNILIFINSILEKETNTNKFSHSFVSIARSFLFEYEDELIFDVFMNKKNQNTTLYKTICNNENFEEFNEKIKGLLSNVESNSLSELMDIIYKKFDIYNLIYKLDNVEIVKEKLSYLLDSIKNLEKLGFSLNDLIGYFDRAFENKIDNAFNNGNSNDNSVNIMTIHKSKGLEFNICYFSGLYKKFKILEQKERFLFNKKYGFVLPVYFEGIKPTILKGLLINNLKNVSFSEQIRLFYVALTRTREKMIFVGELDSYDDSHTEYNSFLDYVSHIKEGYSNNISNIEYENIENDLKESNLENDLNINSCKKLDIITYSKEESKEIGDPINNYHNKKEKELLEMGTKLHMYLEIIDFNNKEKDYIKYNINEFYRKKINNFLNLDLIKDLSKSIVLKEYEYIFENKKNIIDLLIIKEDKIIIIDYKTKNINKESYIKQLNRYEDYIMSISDKKVECYLYSLLDSELLEV